MGLCASSPKTLDLNPDNLRLAALETDMKTAQFNIHVLHEHLEIMTSQMRNEISIIEHAAGELEGCSMGLQERQHVASLQLSVARVARILNPPPDNATPEPSVS